MKHCWVSNSAFTRITGIRAVCMYCGEAKTEESDKICAGKKTVKKEKGR